MKRNENNTDRAIRGAAAVLAAIGAFAAFNGDKTVLGVVLAILTVVLGATAFSGFCPAYTLFGINTCKRK
ncbi:YgaP family membrane protein [Corynebacterium pseudopelargi]|uniref:Inner membrane protein YgaP-like transmembrane domain-containing protein n=1 Tax=Corynebacterium pseudopelargi TaxID=2080757 RepID=A0A3G6ITJ6_9CORY|nr:DUF2892 domain-containing protein [Corynebacterium pseudopelargi]AZA08942.1 hypothetical protein CPPEL_04075 [Corynebacterium pseudopelargi]